MPVSHIWKFDFEQRKKHDLGVKWNFSKIRIEHVKFLATTENIKKIIPEEPELQSRESSRKKRGNCYSQFPDIRLHESRAVLFETEVSAIASKEEIN